MTQLLNALGQFVESMRRLAAYLVIALAAIGAGLAAAEEARRSAYADAVEIDHDRQLVTITEAAARHIAGDNLATIVMQAASSQVMDTDGEPLGFELTQIEPGSVFETIGLRDGDIVTHLDGVPLKTPQIAFNMLVMLKGEPSFTYTVRRPTGGFCRATNPAKCEAYGPALRYTVRVK